MNELNRLSNVRRDLRYIQTRLSQKSENITEEITIWQNVKFGIAQVVGVFGVMGAMKYAPIPEYIRWTAMAMFCAIPPISVMVMNDTKKDLREQRTLVNGLLNETNVLLERVSGDTLRKIHAQDILDSYAVVETTLLSERCQHNQL